MASDLDLEGRFMQHAEYDLLRISLPRTTVHKGMKVPLQKHRDR
jgi:hypothetical protein